MFSQTSAGTLQQINKFYLQLEQILPNFIIKEVKVENQKLERNDERTFSSIGIRDDFICFIKYKNKRDRDESCVCIII